MYPILFSYKGLQISSYGLMLVVAFLTCNYLLRKDLVKKNKNPDIADDIIFRAAIGGVLGAKIYYLLENINNGIAIENIKGPSSYLKLAERYSSMEGFTVMHFSEKFPEAIEELTRLYNSGDIVVPTHYEQGIDSFPKSIQMLFNGGHKGKLMVRM